MSSKLFTSGVSRRRLVSGAVAGSATALIGGRSFAQASVLPDYLTRAARYQGTTITAVVPSFAGAGDEFMRNQAEEFATASGIQVDLQFLPFEKAMDRQTTVVAAQSGEVDVFGTHYAQIGKFGNGMVPLQDLATASEIGPDDYVAGSFDAFTVGGNLLAIPFTFDVRALYYRTDLFEAAGIAEPPTNWENFLETAQKLNQPPDIYGFMMVGKGDPVLREYSDRLWENGGDFLEMGLEPSRPTWNEPAGVEALQWMRDLIWEYEVVPPGAPSYGWEENSQLFAAGQAAMSKQWGPDAMLDPQQSTVIDKFAIAPLTENKTSRTTVVCHGRGINLYSEKQDAAWEYVKYVTSEEQMYKMHQAVANRPAQTAALATAVENAEGIVKQGLEVSLGEADDGYTWPLFAQFAEVQPILWGEIEKVLSNQITAQEGLDNAAEQAIAIFERDGLI